MNLRLLRYSAMRGPAPMARLPRLAAVASALLLRRLQPVRARSIRCFGSEQADATGSITPPPGAKADATLPPEADLAFARAAASDVLQPRREGLEPAVGKPGTGARGTVTPDRLGLYAGRADLPRFPGELRQRQAQSWLQGEACRQSQGDWEVRTLKPWKQFLIRTGGDAPFALARCKRGA